MSNIEKMSLVAAIYAEAKINSYEIPDICEWDEPTKKERKILDRLTPRIMKSALLHQSISAVIPQLADLGFTFDCTWCKQNAIEIYYISLVDNGVVAAINIRPSEVEVAIIYWNMIYTMNELAAIEHYADKVTRRREIIQAVNENLPMPLAEEIIPEVKF